MSHKKPRYDYVAEINVSGSTAVENFCDTLKNEFGIYTSIVYNDHNYSLESKGILPLKFLLNGIPDQIKWSVQTIAPKKCFVTFKYQLSPQVKLGFCLFQSVCSILLFTFYIAFSSSCSKLGYILRATIGELALSVILLCVSLLSIGNIFIFFTLLTRYKSWGLAALRKSLSKSGIDGIVIEKESHLLLGKRTFVDKKMAFYMVFVVFMPLVIFEYKEFLNLPAWFYAVAVFLILLQLLQTSLFSKRNVNKRKLSPLFPLLAINAIIIAVILLMPLVTGHVLKHSQDKISLMRTETGIKQKNVSMYQLISFNLQIKNAAYTSVFQLMHCYGILGVIVIILLFYYSPIFAYFVGEANFHQRNMEADFKQNTDEILHTKKLTKTSHFARAGVWGTFIICSGLSWFGVLVNLSVFGVLLIHSVKIIPLPYGETIWQGTKIIAPVLLGELAGDRTIGLLQCLIIAPFHIPFLLFVFLHIKKSILGYRSMIPLKGYISQAANKVAKQMGVESVVCVVDKERNSYSPSAKISFWKSQNLIIFSENTIRLLSENKEYVEAIVAHEIAHIKNDCKKARKYSIFSKIGLVGSGFLSMLFDSITMEDRADEEAKAYLKDSNKFKAAISLIERAELTRKNEIHENILHPFGLIANTEQEFLKQDLEHENERLVEKIFHVFQIAYKFYFDTEGYDYLHREARYR